MKNPNYFKSKINIPLYPTIKKSDFLFFQPLNNLSNVPDIFYPPEEFDVNFKAKYGFLAK